MWRLFSSMRWGSVGLMGIFFFVFFFWGGGFCFFVGDLFSLRSVTLRAFAFGLVITYASIGLTILRGAFIFVPGKRRTLHELLSAQQTPKI